MAQPRTWRRIAHVPVGRAEMGLVPLHPLIGEIPVTGKRSVARAIARGGVLDGPYKRRIAVPDCRVFIERIGDPARLESEEAEVGHGATGKVDCRPQARAGSGVAQDVGAYAVPRSAVVTSAINATKPSASIAP